LEFNFSKGSSLKIPTPWNLKTFLGKIQIFYFHILAVTLKLTSCRTMSKNKN
jgi:hypothetical protein